MRQQVFVYMIECADGSLYTGWTTALQRRFAEHQRGRGAKYTRSRRPLRLVYWEIVDDRSQALRREHALKKLKRAEKLSLCRALTSAAIDMTS